MKIKHFVLHQTTAPPPRRPKTAQNAPRCSQDALRTRQDTPKTHQDAPKMPKITPRCAQDASKTAKMSPRCARNAPRCTRDDGNIVGRAQRASERSERSERSVVKVLRFKFIPNVFCQRELCMFSKAQGAYPKTSQNISNARLIKRPLGSLLE